jgi:aminomethyltransferase
MPLLYQGIVAEHQAVRSRAGLFDVSHMGELLLRGDGAEDVVNRLVTNDLRRLDDGCAMYTCACNDQGGILDDLIVYKRSPEQVLIVCNASNREKMTSHFSDGARGRCAFVDETDQTALLALQGPRALDILRAASISVDVNEVPAFRFRDAEVAGVPCTVARTGYTGEDGVELFCATAMAPRLWGALLEAGRKWEITPAGLGARDTLRLEARLCLYGNDIDETTNPLEAGLGWTVKLVKGSFVGRAALERLKALPPRRSLVGFEMLGRGVARHGYALLASKEGEPVGVCTSGAPSPTLGKNIGLGYLPVSMSAAGTEFFVDCRGKKIEAQVVKTPFYMRAS